MKNEQPTTKETTREILRDTLREVSPYFTLGIQLGAAVVLCCGIGWWLDAKYEWDPWGKIVGAFIGAAGGMVKFLQSVKELTRKNNGTDASH